MKDLGAADLVVVTRSIDLKQRCDRETGTGETACLLGPKIRICHPGDWLVY